MVEEVSDLLVKGENGQQFFRLETLPDVTIKFRAKDSNDSD
jgi:hypothetical protein